MRQMLIFEMQNIKDLLPAEDTEKDLTTLMLNNDCEEEVLNTVVTQTEAPGDTLVVIVIEDTPDTPQTPEEIHHNLDTQFKEAFHSIKIMTKENQQEWNWFLVGSNF